MDKIKKILYFVVPTFALVLVVAQIIVTNQLASVRNDIHTIDSEISALSDEFDLLSHQVASASALATISQKAVEAGFISPTKNNVVALVDTLPVAVNLPANSSGQNTVQ